MLAGYKNYYRSIVNFGIDFINFYGHWSKISILCVFKLSISIIYIKNEFIITYVLLVSIFFYISKEFGLSLFTTALHITVLRY